MGSNGMGSNSMKSARLHTKGFTLIASLLLLLLLSGIAIGLMLMVNTEGKVGGTDLQNNLAYHAAEGGIEKMASDLATTFQNAQAPHTTQICGVGGPPYGSAANEPAMIGVNWQQYSVTPASGCVTDPPTANWGQIISGPNQNLWAQIIPISMLATASMPGGQEVTMTRGAQVALIPVFQFGVFCDGDCGFFDSPTLSFAGRVHTNGDLYLGVGGGNKLTFGDKMEAYGNVVTEVLPNGLGPTGASWDDTGNVFIPTTPGGCSFPGTATSTCKLKDANGSSTFGDGSVQGAGGNPSSTYNTSVWNTFSKTTTNHMIINGNYGSTSQPGTGATKLSMPFVQGTTYPYEIIRRPRSTDGTALSQSREYNLAQIHVLLSDDPADLPGGSADTNNVRLANVVGCASPCTPYGIATSHPAGLPTLTGGSTYNTYFATASNVIPSADCNSSTACPSDWPYPPAPWTATMMSAVGAGTDPNCVLLCPTGAPYISNNGTTVSGGSAPALSGTGLPAAPPALALCSPTNTATASIPAGCPTTAPPVPYYAANSTAPAATNADTQLTATWNLIDGWLRVEYKDVSGNWHPVTNEWLTLGFARGLTAPTLPGSSAPTVGTNPINPDAILLLQEPADRSTATTDNFPSQTTLLNGSAETALGTTGVTGTAPTCTHTTSGKCTAWSGAPPQLLVDTAGSAVWQFGVTTTVQAGALASSTLSGATGQSLTRFNWYPINFYDAREGEPRDTVWSAAHGSDNSCTPMGVMNAVEIDVGNLNRWLNGAIGTSGSSVDYAAQNGYVLYFSDRRGMLPNPNLGTSFTKSGDSGFEDVINANGAGDGANGTPDGVLEPTPANKTLSPEDVNQNGLLDAFGTANLGLSFYGTGTTGTVNLNYFVTQATPDDPFGTASYNSRMASCSVARKNWVSGARHVLKLVDGSLG